MYGHHSMLPVPCTGTRVRTPVPEAYAIEILQYLLEYTCTGRYMCTLELDTDTGIAIPVLEYTRVPGACYRYLN